MLDLLHRTSEGSVLVDKPAPHEGPGPSPPSHGPPPVPDATAPWPFRAKLFMVILAVLALAGAAGTIIGFATGGDEATTDGTASVADLQATIDDLTTERDDLAGQVGDLESSLAAAETERGALAAQLAVLDAANDAVTAERDALTTQLAGVQATIDELTAERDAVTAQLTSVQAAIDDLTAQLTAADATIAGLESDVAGLESDVTGLEGDLADQVALTAAAVSERDALAALFPLSFDATLEKVDLVGTYDVDYTSVYCDGFANCGTVPSVDEMTIVETSQGWLRVEMDGYFNAGLFLVDGSLYAIAETMTAVPDCNGVARDAVVSLTLYAHGLTVADDGTHVIDDLGASMTVQAPAVGTCERGLAFYGASLTPVT